MPNCMKIRFNEIDTTSIERFYGGEGSMEAKRSWTRTRIAY